MFLQESIHRFPGNPVVLLIYDVARHLNAITSFHIINTRKCLSLQHVSTLPHVGHAI
jgi:hypothetical protein